MDAIGDRLGIVARELAAQFVDWIVTLDWIDVALATLVVALVVSFRNLLARIAVRLVTSLGTAIGVPIGENVSSVMRPAARTTIVATAFLIAVDLLDLPLGASQTLERILTSVIITSFFAGVYILSAPFAELLAPYRTASTKIQVDWLLGLAKAIVVILGIAAVLSVWEIDLGPVLTGMGVIGAGVALAAQDLLRNLIGGITNMSENRFAAGDWIRVEGVIEGVVEAVEFRSTQVRRFDKALVHVPNGDLANGPLVNFSRMPHRRIFWRVSLVYSTTTEQLAEVRRAIEQYIDESGEFVSGDQAPRFVRIDTLSESSIDILVYCFTKTSAWGNYLEAKERLLLAIKEAVERSGSSFAFPSRSIYLEAAATAGPAQFVAGHGVASQNQRTATAEA